MTAELEEARDHYFAAGGLESDIGPRNDPNWYWRRAAKLWRQIAESRKCRNCGAVHDCET